ncbi:hypothetical protein ACH79_15705 [Bradyrhizobium sp. CCBAU 051011]|nr:hypothetical protein ACH79_15705 [Bradyrhizobium sp. CCBAU 051011]
MCPKLSISLAAQPILVGALRIFSGIQILHEQKGSKNQSKDQTKVEPTRKGPTFIDGIWDAVSVFAGLMERKHIEHRRCEFTFSSSVPF